MSCCVVLCQKGDRLETSVVAGDIRNSSMTCKDKLVNKERLTGQEECGDKSVPCAQFGVDGLHDLKTHVA